MSKKPAAIGIAAIDSQATVPLLQQAKDAGIPVIAFDSGVDSDIPITSASTDNLASAALAADKMSELIGGEGEVAVVSFDQTSQTGIERRDGFVDAHQGRPSRASRWSPVQYGGGDHLKSAEIARRSCSPIPTSRASSAPMKARPSAWRSARRKPAATSSSSAYDSGKAQTDAIRDGTIGRRDHAEPGRHRLRAGQGRS